MPKMITFTVPALTCDRCVQAVSPEVAGLEAVEVDLDTKAVRPRGTGLDDTRLRAAIEEAGYEALR